MKVYEIMFFILAGIAFVFYVAMLAVMVYDAWEKREYFIMALMGFCFLGLGTLLLFVFNI